MPIMRACLLALVVSGFSPFFSLPMWADCRSDYDEVMTRLSKAKQQAIKGQQLDSNAFMAEFQTPFERLKEGGCVSEIMQILQHAQAEQQTYGGGPAAPQAPSP